MVDFACLYERFDPTVALEPGDAAYVDWLPQVGLGDVKQQLSNSLRLTRSGYVHRLFTGHRGGGKTTELKRVRDRHHTGTGDRRFFVSFLDADDTMDLDDVDPTDLVLAIVRQLVTDLRAAGIAVEIGGRFKTFLEGTRDALRGLPDAGLDLSVGDPAGIAELSMMLKRQPSVRREVRRLLEGRLPTLYDAINQELLPAARRHLAGRGFADVLVIVDQLDRMPPGDDRHHKVFLEGRGKLKALDCHVIYTVPIEYARSRAVPALENEYGDLLGLPLLPVSAADPLTAAAAVACAHQVVTKRTASCQTAEADLFASPTTIDELVCLSGGHLRSLFLLVRTAIETSDLVAPLTPQHIQRVTHTTAAKYLDTLEPAERVVARGVHETLAKPAKEAHLDLFYELLRDQYVFAYAAGTERWYDWNPLLGLSALAAP